MPHPTREHRDEIEMKIKGYLTCSGEPGKTWTELMKEAKKDGISKPTLSRYLKRFEDYGFVVREVDSIHRPPRPLYNINIAPPPSIRGLARWVTGSEFQKSQMRDALVKELLARKHPDWPQARVESTKRYLDLDMKHKGVDSVKDWVADSGTDMTLDEIEKDEWWREWVRELLTRPTPADRFALNLEGIFRRILIQMAAAYLWVSKFPADTPHLAGRYLKAVIEQNSSLFGDTLHDLDYWAAEMIGTRDILEEAMQTALKSFGIKADDLNKLQPYLMWKPSIPAKQARPVSK